MTADPASYNLALDHALAALAKLPHLRPREHGRYADGQEAQRGIYADVLLAWAEKDIAALWKTKSDENPTKRSGPVSGPTGLATTAGAVPAGGTTENDGKATEWPTA